MRVLLLLTMFSVGCAGQGKEAAIAAGLAGGVAACDELLADPSVQATPEARAWCQRLLNGCREDRSLLDPY